MKNTIDFLNGLPMKQSENFKNNVLKALPKGVKTTYLISVGMTRVGTGAYIYFLHLEINDERITLTIPTNCAPDYDDFTELEFGTPTFENWCKATTLKILHHHCESIGEALQEPSDFWY